MHAYKYLYCFMLCFNDQVLTFPSVVLLKTKKKIRLEFYNLIFQTSFV